MQDADLKQGKVSPEQHKYWRYVAPVRSYFDWLPEKIANTFCSTALEAFAGRQYGELEHLEEMDNPRFASMCFQNIYHIGDTKSGQELEVFLAILSVSDWAVEYNVLKPCFRLAPINGHACMLRR